MKALPIHPFSCQPLSLTAAVGLIVTEPSGPKGQRSVYLHTTMHVDGRPARNFKVVVLCRDNEEERIYGSGSFSLLLPSNSQFSVVIGKQGYISETLLIDTNIPKSHCDSATYYANVELLPESHRTQTRSRFQVYGKISFNRPDGNFRLQRLDTPPPGTPISVPLLGAAAALSHSDWQPGRARQQTAA